MKKWPNHPVILEINTWVWLHELSRKTGYPVRLGTIPRNELDRLADCQLDGIWLMGVWKRSAGARELDQKNPKFLEKCRNVLSDFTHDDIAGSPYAIDCYQIDPALGNLEELDILREQFRQRGLHLILDFVPNHFGCTNAWLAAYPERFVRGNEDDLQQKPAEYFQAHGHIFARGRDRYFVWPDTVQLDYRLNETRLAMSDILLEIAEHCDGVRCDMAMLTTSEIIQEIWNGELDPPVKEFWPSAIRRVKAVYPDFLLIAEVYWNMEYTLQQQGFDYTYDKRLYDRLVDKNVHLEQMHLHGASIAYQNHLVRFLENHDEERAIVSFGAEYSKAAAVLSFTLPGMRLLHEGQMEGHQVKLPVQLGRRPEEIPNPELAAFYRKLLAALRDPLFHDGTWELLNPKREWAENLSYRYIIAYKWNSGEQCCIVIVNLAESPSQCFLPLNIPELARHTGIFTDFLGDTSCEREGDDLLNRGLFLNLPGYGYHLFMLQIA